MLIHNQSKVVINCALTVPVIFVTIFCLIMISLNISNEISTKSESLNQYLPRSLQVISLLLSKPSFACTFSMCRKVGIRSPKRRENNSLFSISFRPISNFKIQNFIQCFSKSNKINSYCKQV